MSKTLVYLVAGLLASISLAVYSNQFTFSLIKPKSTPKVVTPATETKLKAATLYGPVNTESAIKTIDQIRKLQDGSTKPIYLYIDSPGGEIFAGIKIIDAMQASKRPIYTVDIGMAASMAAWIESYGVKRYMLPHAYLMYHNASTGIMGDIVRDRSQLDFLDKMVSEMNANVAKRSGVPLNDLLFKENSEWWLTSDESMKAHLVDGIIDPIDFPSEKKSDFDGD